MLNVFAMKKIVFLTGAGMSVESGFKTFRGNDGLWENVPVEKVATHEAWYADPDFVTGFARSSMAPNPTRAIVSSQPWSRTTT